jgi:DNA-binding LacI/PurR family transcriptional regulator
MNAPRPSVTLNDVAARCGVSYQTVSRVANGSRFVAQKTRTRILEAIHELGYRPNLAARRLVTRRSGVIGMVASDLTYHGPAQLMVSVEETARRRDYSLMFVGIERSSDTQLEAAIDHLCKHQVDGLVVGANIKGKVDLVRQLCRGVPFVTLDRARQSNAPAVVVDQSLGVRLAIKHLLDLGHRRIACIAGPAGWPASEERRNAFVRALRRAGVEPGPIAEGDWSAQSGYDAALRLLESEGKKPTAIVAGNDQMALGAMRALRQKRIKVPDQISVVGYDDLPESQFFEPPLTTVHNDFARQGERCIETLLCLMNQETVASTLEVLRPELVVRRSTARC